MPEISALSAKFFLNRSQQYHLRILLMTGGALFFAVVGNVTPGAVNIGGFPLPVFCPFRLFTGLDCPGCGLTRSVLLALHVRLYESYLLHLWGIPLAALILLQIPYRLLSLWAGTRLRVEIPGWFQPWKMRLVLASLVVPWIMKTGALLWVRLQ